MCSLTKYNSTQINAFSIDVWPKEKDVFLKHKVQFVLKLLNFKNKASPDALLSVHLL